MLLGHRLEGQRQRGDEEGQTFTKEVNKPVLPSFLSVADYPTPPSLADTWLSGTYAYDDEGQKAKKVDLIQDGVLKTSPDVAPADCQLSEFQWPWPRQTGRVPNGAARGNLHCDFDQG